LATHLSIQPKDWMAAQELMRYLDINYRAVWQLKHKVMQMRQRREEQCVLKERIEVDGALFKKKGIGLVVKCNPFY
jgi:hypothetical protein